MRTFLITIGTLILAVVACSPTQVTVPLATVSTSGVSGLVVLTPDGSGTAARIELSGLRPRAAYEVQLQGGSCGEPSASVAQIARVVADADGRGSSAGPVRYRGSNDIDLRTVADGSRLLSVRTGDGEVVACGLISALR